MNTTVVVRRHTVSPPFPKDPPPPPAALGLVVALAEAMLGRRPLHQLRPYTDPQSLYQLTRYVDAGTARHMTISKVRTQMPTPRALEAVVQLRYRNRHLACVIRLDAGMRNWRCTELRLLTPQGWAR